jgi:hypothetical protein
MVYAVIGVEGLLGVVALIGFLRLWLHRKLNERAFQQFHLKEDHITGKDGFSKEEYERHQLDAKLRQQTSLSIAQRQKLVEKRDEGELAKTKARLKREFIERNA